MYRSGLQISKTSQNRSEKVPVHATALQNVDDKYRSRQ